jgi:hypothetical protein
VSFVGLVTAVMRRPGMWLPDDRWTTALAFLIGAAASDPSSPLAGLQEWATVRLGRAGTSTVWYSVLFESLEGEPGVWPRPYDLSDAENDSVREAMYGLVLEYLTRFESAESSVPQAGDL